MSGSASKAKLNELHLNLLGKIFFASAAAFVAGHTVNVAIRGTRDEVKAVANALMASRKFQEELRRPGATVDSVVQRLGIKQMTAREFERVLGVPWPL